MFGLFSKKDKEKKKKKADSDEEEDESKDSEREPKEKGGDDDEEENEGPAAGPLFLAECVNSIMKQTQWSDVIFLVGPKKTKITAHRFILAVSSPVFDAMLYRATGFDGEEAKAGEGDNTPLPLQVNLPDEDADTFAAMLQCIYSDQLKVDADAVQGLIKIASKFEIEKLKQLCTDFVSEEVTEDNALDLLTMSTTLGTDASGIMTFIADHAEEVLQSDGFLKLDKQAVKVLLGDDKLAASEIAVMNAILAWGKAEAKRQKTGTKMDDIKMLIADLMPLIRFPLLTVEELATQVPSTGLLDQNVLVMLFAYCAQPEEKKKSMASTVPFPTKAREGAFPFKKSKIFESKHNKNIMKLLDCKRCKVELLYRGSDHGFDANSFHTRVDGRGATLTVVRGNNHIFGGYNGDSWSQNGGYSTSECWLFNLVNSANRPPSKFITTTTNKAYHAAGYGPTWGGGHDLHISSSMKNPSSNYSSPSAFTTPAPGFENSGTFANTTLAGSYYFVVDEIEIWGIKK